MTRPVYDALESHFDDFAVEEPIHDVPPHRVYQVIVDGRRAVCKLDAHPEGTAEREGRLLDLLGERTTLPVPEVLAVGDGHFVADWIEGVPSGAPEHDVAWERHAGRCLATLHDETAGLFDRPGPFRAVDGELTVASRDTHALAFAATLDDYADFLEGFDRGAPARRVEAFFRDNPDLLADAGPPVVTHGNPEPAHVAVADGEVVALLDFEHAQVSPAGRDYHWASLYHGEGAAARRTAFREGYASVRDPPDSTYEPAYRAVHAVWALRSLYLQDQHERGERESAAAEITTWADDALAACRRRWG